MKNEKCEYENDGERITAPGKFEGEPVFAPYYWGLALEGFADADDGVVFTFRFSKASLGTVVEKLDAPEAQDQLWAVELKQWLGRSRTLHMWEDDQGFVHCG